MSYLKLVFSMVLVSVMLVATSAPAHSAVQHRTHPGVVVVDRPTPSGVNPHVKPTCGIISCTLYFNKSETKKLARGAALVLIVAALLPPPWNITVAAIAGWVAVVAGWAVEDKQCVKIKSYGGAVQIPLEYSGGYCK